MQPIRIATRMSPMALLQANDVKNKLLKVDPHLDIQIIGVQTEGDLNTSVPLISLGGKQVFIKALQLSLLKQETDLAVHCVKDMSVFSAPEFTLAAMLKRDDPRDALVTRAPHSITSLPKNAIIGTGSPRRTLLLQSTRPDLIIKDLRGNVNTRLKKLDDGQYDGIILSLSGLQRLNLSHRVQEKLPIDSFIPAIGQGAIAVECLSTNAPLISLVQKLNDPITQYRVIAEQAVNQVLNGNCHSPIGAHATYRDGMIQLQAIVGSPSTHQYISASAYGELSGAQSIGSQLGQKLLDKGALALIQES